ncbi:MAG: DUF2490 domain-containing protein [Bacteroidetes bacterium]|nr:DUF2490 domain-containing protein [Bacteroidota bacterium]
MLRMQAPLRGKEINDRIPYVAVYDGFIGFGKNVNENIFDQNRIGVLLGYKFNFYLEWRPGYFNQNRPTREVNIGMFFRKIMELL